MNFNIDKLIERANKLLKEEYQWVDDIQCRRSILEELAEKGRIELSCHKTKSGRAELIETEWLEGLV